ncbi:MAG: photosystem II stability/assembly factor-like uncharacterized protein [Spirosomataceae bacterium]|jgi:photosystem II stability/assembly factor-like uncharacterized protein
MFSKRILSFFLLLITSIASAQTLDLSKLENLKIRNVGPANMSGRITSIDVSTDNPKLMYVGAASGGVWKSENGGTAWNPVFDEQPTQNIGAVRIQQSNPNVIWAGTGEGNPRNSMNLGMGIFKSMDGGKTWQHMGLTETKTIHRIIIDPTDPNTVYVGAMGDPFTPNEHRGLFKTTDGGKSWKRILSSNNLSGIADLVMDPTNPNKLFAALYEHRRTPYYFTSGGEGSGMYVTYDKGETWQQLNEKQGLPAGNLGRIGIAIAPSNPNRVYAKVEATRNALYRSDDAGLNWYVVNDNPRFTNNRPFYFQELSVDTKDPNRLYNIYQPLSVSYDGGKTFDPEPMIPADETKGIHADFHAFWVNPNDPQHFVIGGDGGLGITHDHGKSWYFPETIPVAQFYHVGVDYDTPFNVYGGMQDNGNWSGPAYTWKRGGIRTLYWQYLVGGDGFYISPDKDNSRFGYGTSQNGDLYRYDKLTGYYSSIKPPAPDLKTELRFNWNAAFARDFNKPDKAYYGSQFVHVTEDKGATWKIISPDLSTNNPESQKGDYGGLTLDVSGAEMYNSILSIAPSALDENVIWAGTDDGQIQLSTDGGKSWKNITKNVKGLPNEAWIAQIQASRYKAGTAWMVANNYRKGDYAPCLFKTEDFGKSWKRMVNEADVKGYALSVVQDPIEPKLVFLGTENGLWVSIDEGNSWTQVKNGFPSVSTMDLVIQEKESALVIGTFGRAIWVLDDLKSLREVAANRLKPNLTALPMNDAVQVKGLFINPPGNIWSGFNTTFEGENRPFQATEIPFFVNEKPTDKSKVVARIYNDKNELINSVETADLKTGLNYVLWQLDEQVSNAEKKSSREIPVLPGSYKIVLEYKGAKDSTSVNVIPDPRFDIPAEVDVQLHNYQKTVYTENTRLDAAFAKLDKRKALLDKIEKHYTEQTSTDNKAILNSIEKLKTEIAAVREKGRPTAGDRQVGAWQTLAVSPHSKMQDAQMAAMSRHVIPSEQDWQKVEEAKQLISTFESQVDAFISTSWKGFEEEVKRVGFDWFGGME